MSEPLCERPCARLGVWHHFLPEEKASRPSLSNLSLDGGGDDGQRRGGGDQGQAGQDGQVEARGHRGPRTRVDNVDEVHNKDVVGHGSWIQGQRRWATSRGNVDGQRRGATSRGDVDGQRPWATSWGNVEGQRRGGEGVTWLGEACFDLVFISSRNEHQIKTSRIVSTPPLGI